MSGRPASRARLSRSDVTLNQRPTDGGRGKGLYFLWVLITLNILSKSKFTN